MALSECKANLVYKSSRNTLVDSNLLVSFCSPSDGGRKTCDTIQERWDCPVLVLVAPRL